MGPMGPCSNEFPDLLHIDPTGVAGPTCLTRQPHARFQATQPLLDPISPRRTVASWKCQGPDRDRGAAYGARARGDPLPGKYLRVVHVMS